MVYAYLAYASGRAYVYRSVFLEIGRDFPFNAFFSGPSSGARVWGPELDAPRAVSTKFWEKACPPERRKIIRMEQVAQEVQMSPTPDGDEILSKWARYLEELDESCVEIDGWSSSFLDLDLYVSSLNVSDLRSTDDNPLVCMAHIDSCRCGPNYRHPRCSSMLDFRSPSIEPSRATCN